MMITTLTTLRWNALVMVGCSLLVSTAAVATTQQPDAAQPQQPAVINTMVSVADAKRQTTAATQANEQLNNAPLELISIRNDADGMVNLFDLAKELDEAITAQQGEMPQSASPTQQAQAASTTEPNQRSKPLQFAQAATSKQMATDATPVAPATPAVAPAVAAQQEQARIAEQQAREAQARALVAQIKAEEAEIARIKASEAKAEREYVASVRAKAFREIELDAFPMTPEHIKKLRQKLDETERATEVPAGTPPKPVSTSLIVNLSPGTTPPVIRLGKGFVSSLVFVDATGAPWQILSYDVGAPDVFNVQWDKDSNMLLLQSNKPYTYGNIAVNLVGLNTPVMMTLVPGQKEIDYRVDLRVQALGPNPNQNLIDDGMPANANALLLNFLNGVAPDVATPLTVHGSHTQAWEMKNKLYVRSRFKVISPSWLASMTSADGTHVYELPKTPILLLSRHGKVVSMQLEGF